MPAAYKAVQEYVGTGISRCEWKMDVAPGVDHREYKKIWNPNERNWSVGNISKLFKEIGGQGWFD